ncbi:hypothetical protein HA466_0268290 [Hirschfeldia incana]|nr:hypothetical protein HA466_0268290 [Hirschfeldia incana]
MLFQVVCIMERCSQEGYVPIDGVSSYYWEHRNGELGLYHPTQPNVLRSTYVLYSASFVSKDVIPADQYALRIGGNHDQSSNLSFTLCFWLLDGNTMIDKAVDFIRWAFIIWACE